jgi:putative tryptophan/tyrosine transport system substrate-binding protein
MIALPYTSFAAVRLWQCRQVGLYAAGLLKGAKPMDLPVMRATKFELVVNLQTGKILGLEVPAMLLARADKVID